MRLLDIISSTCQGNITVESVVSKLRSGIPLSESETGFASDMLSRVGPDDPFSKTGGDFLSDDELEDMGLTRSDLGDASFNSKDKPSSAVDPFEIDSQTNGVESENPKDDTDDCLGDGSLPAAPEEDIPETVINMNDNFRDTDGGGKDGDDDDDEGKPKIEESLVIKPFPRMAPTTGTPRVRKITESANIPEGASATRKMMAGIRQNRNESVSPELLNLTPDQMANRILGIG